MKLNAWSAPIHGLLHQLIIYMAKCDQSTRLQQKIAIISVANPKLTHREIAALVKCSPKTVYRALYNNREFVAETAEILEQQLKKELGKRQSMKAAAENLVELAENAKNEAVRLGAQERVLEWQDMRSAKERAKDKSTTAIPNGPLFILPENARISVVPSHITVNHTTIEEGMRDVTPEENPPEKLLP